MGKLKVNGFIDCDLQCESRLVDNSQTSFVLISVVTVITECKTWRLLVDQYVAARPEVSVQNVNMIVRHDSCLRFKTYEELYL